MSSVSSSKHKSENVPVRRFPEFNGDWETAKLGDIGTFTKGAPLSKADISDDGAPFILYGELYTTYGEVTYDIKRRTDKIVPEIYYSRIGDVIIPTSGETPEEIATATCVMLPDVILAGDLNIYRTNVVDGRIISFVINHIVNDKISKVAQGKSIVHVKSDELSKIEIKYPKSDEQQKILYFFEMIDKRISKQRELLEGLKLYKRGVLSAIFDRKVNFSESKWESVKINEILKYEQPQKYIVKCENYSDEYDTPVLTANKGFILGFTNETNGIYDKGDVIIYDDFTMDMKYVDFPFKVKSSTIKMLTPIGNYNLYFIFALLQSLNLQPEGHQRSYISIVEQISVKIPSIAEQNKIANFLLAIQKQIETANSILCNLERAKSAMLQQMFI